jgi:hypothetical protein
MYKAHVASGARTLCAQQLEALEQVLVLDLSVLLAAHARHDALKHDEPLGRAAWTRAREAPAHRKHTLD